MEAPKPKKTNRSRPPVKHEPGKAAINHETGKLELIDEETGEILTEKANPNRATRYDEYFHSQIIKYGYMGYSPGWIAKILKIKPHTIYKWIATHAELKKDYEGARAASTYAYEDKIEAVAENVTDKDDVPVAKLKIETYQYLAEKNNPHRYAKKGNENEAGPRNITLHFDTGIVRNKEPKDVIAIESTEKIEDKTK